MLLKIKLSVCELAKYESWELSNEVIKQLCETETVWRNTKSKGVGQTTILKFLAQRGCHFKKIVYYCNVVTIPLWGNI